MKRMMITMLAAATLLSACASGSGDVSRSISPITLATQGAAVDVKLPKVMVAQYNVSAVNVSVPADLSVSEANMFYPIADIVWRGEPMGSRHQQVKTIFLEAAAEATGTMKQGATVVVDLQVQRFHSVTEKTRFTVGGVHDMKYSLTVRDAATGTVVDGPRLVHAEVKAAGGAQAVAEDQMGRTQRVVVIERLVRSIREELSAQVTDPLLVSQALGLDPAEVTASTN
ncbi:DUF6778 family protein [Thioclava sp. FR2]|uniref:DUF6778 family protein n=1 Tax=Thioclava sp. FR2 TaxID=3445780 RepID=UPI003EC00D9C